MVNGYYVKHKSDKRVTLSVSDRILIQNLLKLEIAFQEHELNKLNKTLKPPFSVEHMKELYKKISGRKYDDVY